jgi:hypothetical protein
VRLLNQITLLIVLAWFNSAFAADPNPAADFGPSEEQRQSAEESQSRNNLKSSDRFKRLGLSVDSEYIRMKSKLGILQGLGIRIGARYALSKKWAITLGVGQAFDSSASSALFTDFHLHASYAVLGRYLSQDQDISFNNTPFLEVTEKPSSTLSLSAGLDQYFFNASVAAVAASGAGAALIYTFPVWGIFMNVGLRTTYLVTSSQNLTSLGGVIGLNWSF